MIENEPKDLEEFIDLTKANKEAVIPPDAPSQKHPIKMRIEDGRAMLRMMAAC